MNAPDHETISLSIETLLDQRHTLNTETKHQPHGQGLWLGPFRGARRGQGTEFDDLRHYSAGDDIRHIDWKASARTNSMHTRLYREEREFRTTLVVDFRDAMFTGSSQLQAVRVGKLAARILWQASDGGCRTQILIVTDKGIHASNSGTGHQSAIGGCSLLARIFSSIQTRLDENKTRTAKNTTEPNTGDSFFPLCPSNIKSERQAIHLDRVADWVLQDNRKSENLFWLSPFDDCGAQFKVLLQQLCVRGNQIAIAVDDELINNGLPVGRYGYQYATYQQSKSQTTWLNKITLLGRNNSKRVLKSLHSIKNERQMLLEESLMTIVNSDKSNIEIIASLRHWGFLP